MKIELSPFSPEDIGRLISWVDSEELLLRWAGTFFEHPLTLQQCQDYWQTSQGDSPTRLIFKALDKSNGGVVGHIELDGFDYENESAFVSRVLVGANAQRGLGIGQSIVLELVDAAFTQLSLHRLAVGVMEFNAAAIRCYEKCGFKYEGCYRDIVKNGDTYHSVITMSLLRDEWLNMKA